MRARDAAHRFRLLAPRIGTGEVEFEWEVTPSTDLYRANGFRLSFPSELDLGHVPESLWLRLAMICLHTHWALLRPCLVELPFYLGPGEREFWQRLAGVAAAQVEVYGATVRAGPAVAIHDHGPALRPVAISARDGRAAAAFSGGKDSLTQAGLLAELTDRPLLVTTTSPVSWLTDQGSARERVLSEITRRLPVDLVEIRSDFRACWDNGYSRYQGCSLAINELTDVLLYQATTLAAAAASGIGRALMASEADIQYNVSLRGAVIQHDHFAASVVTMGALDALVRKFGLALGSLTYPLHGDQVQSLLLNRYGMLAELQYSCWSATDGGQACSICGQCFEIALMLLSEGISPRRAGIDPGRVLIAWAEPRPGASPPPLPVPRPARERTLRIVQQTDVEQVSATLAEDPAREQAIDGYRRLRRRLMERPVAPPHPGYVAGFLERVPCDLREGLRTIFDQHFTAGTGPELDAVCARSLSLTRWITDPLGD